MVILKPLAGKSIKYTWLITYVVLFLVPIILCIILFLLVDGTIKNQVNNTNYFALKQMQQYMDAVISEATRIAGNLAFNERVQKISGFKGDITPEERYEIILLNRDMVNSNYSSEIEEVYVYFRQIDTVISSKHVMDSKYFFDLFGERYGTDSNEWNKMNQETHKGSYINLGSQNKRLVYMITKSLSLNEGINVAVIINVSNLLEIIKDVNIINRGNLAIINKNNQLILSSSNMDFLQTLKFNSFQNNSLVQYTDSNGNTVQISCIDSYAKGWKYLYIMPTEDYWKQPDEYRKLILAGISVSMVISCIIAFCLFRKNYEPIKRLLMHLKGTQQINKNEDNEYGIIQNAIIRSLEDKKELEKWRTYQKKVSNEKYIKELLTGNTLDQPLDDDLIDIEFKRDYFSVTAFSADMDTPSSVLNLDLTEDFELLHFIIHNMLDELLKDTCRIYTVNFDNIIFFLMNYHTKEEKHISTIKEVTAKIQDIVKEYYEIDLIIAIGSIYEGKDFIKQSYKETRQLLEFEEIVGGEDILVYSESKKFLLNENNYNYFYPRILEEALINAVRSGQFVRISTILEEVFNYNLKELTLSSNMAQCLKCSIIGTLINTLNSFINSSGKKYQKEIVSLEKLIQCKSMNKVKEQLLIILKDICGKINSDKKAASHIGDSVILFIKENLADEDLNVSMIADNFDLHPNYISKLFKQQVGIGLLDYINIMRVEEAKKLLKSEKGNLESIAKKVGYSNVKTFTRVFTKIQGITPGKYRDDLEFQSV